MNTRKIVINEPLKLINGIKRIKSAPPAKKEHKLFIEQAYSDCTFEDEYFNDIIAIGNKWYSELIDQSQFSKLFNDICKYCIDYDSITYEIDNLKSEYSYYKNATEIINDLLSVKANKYQVGQVKKILALENIDKSKYTATRQNSDDYIICALMSLFTGLNWEKATITGYCQGDWQYIYYPTEIYNSEDIKAFNYLYFGMHMDYCASYKGNTCWYQFNDYEELDDIKKWIASDYGVSIKNVIYRSIN